MSRIRIVGEDTLCCALGERMVAETLPEWTLAGDSINTRGRTKLVPALPRYVQQAEYVQPILCLADSDHQCPFELVHQWLPRGVHNRFLLRLAISEAESWVLADREGAAEFFGVALKHLPREPEKDVDAKRTVLRIAKLSSKRLLRTEMVSEVDSSKPGSGYNLHLSKLIAEKWEPIRASEQSPSLNRALFRLRALAQPV